MNVPDGYCFIPGGRCSWCAFNGESIMCPEDADGVLLCTTGIGLGCFIRDTDDGDEWTTSRPAFLSHSFGAAIPPTPEPLNPGVRVLGEYTYHGRIVFHETELDMYACACGFHYGLDTRYFEANEGDDGRIARIQCPQCGAVLDHKRMGGL